jgi:hypothetical protein
MTDRHGHDGTESYFECTLCGATDRSDAIDYDTLGYPVCPDCGFGPGLSV